VRKRQREMALAALAIVLCAAAAWRIRSGAGPASTGDAVAERVARATGPAAPTAPNATTAVDLESLQSERPEPDETNRNPFRFKSRPEPVVPQDRTPVSSTPTPTGPVEPPQPPRIPLKYIGEVQDRSKPGRVAVLSDARGVYYGREGEIIEGRYRIVKIGVESIELAYLDGRGRQTIRQTGQ